MKIIVTYKVKSELEPEVVAKKIANEQSLGGKGKEEYSASIEEVKEIKDSIKIKLGFPTINFGNDLAALSTNIIGEVHNIKDMRIKVEDIQFPEDYLDLGFKGPKYGVEGIRGTLQIHNRPLLCGPVKPCLGLTPKEFAERAYEAWIGGIDIVKDDELLVSPEYCELEERVARTVEKWQEVMDKTGEQKMYVVDIGGSSRHIDDYLSVAQKYGVSGVLINPSVNGVDFAMRIPTAVFAHNGEYYSSAREPDARVAYS
jgi:2,3-diketo-5-methylthiopentyl-1-phosphate enolase